MIFKLLCYFFKLLFLSYWQHGVLNHSEEVGHESSVIMLFFKLSWAMQSFELGWTITLMHSPAISLWEPNKKQSLEKEKKEKEKKKKNKKKRVTFHTNKFKLL